jgi:hypothetical protein
MLTAPSERTTNDSCRKNRPMGKQKTMHANANANFVDERKTDKGEGRKAEDMGNSTPREQ